MNGFKALVQSPADSLVIQRAVEYHSTYASAFEGFSGISVGVR